MKIKSLSFRLFLAASISVSIALFTTGIAFSYFFKTYFEDRVTSELATHLQQLTANIDIDIDGQFVVIPLSDQRFDQPFSGLYWQIDVVDALPIYSRSLWDAPLALQRPDKLGMQVSQRITDADLNLMVLSWIVTIGGTENPVELMLSVATDFNSIRVTQQKFNKNLALWLSILAAALIFAAWLQVRIGLRPLEAIRVEISKVRDGTAQQMPDDLPSEVAPLVAEVNALLENQRETLTLARQHASDLAHGLKTPLTIMRVLAQQIRTGQTTGMAEQIEEQAQAMAHFVERELARSRAGHEISAQSKILPVALKMVAAISKLPSTQPVDWHVDIPPDLLAPFDAFDLSEILGNILDNAREWTQDHVSVTGSVLDGKTCLSIKDNGPGVPKDQLFEVLQRGKRADPTRPGYGLGLAIVQDMVNRKNCALTLANHPDGGLEVLICWQ